MSGDILDLIDGTLNDWAASGDAMRWNPEPRRLICDGGEPLWPAPLFSLSRFAMWDAVRAAMRQVAEAARTRAAELSGIAAGVLSLAGDATVILGSCDELRFEIERATSELAGGTPYETVAGPLEWSTAVTFTPGWHIFAELGFWRDGRKQLHKPHRCRVCNPRGNPPKLPIDGCEYHRRRKARKRRKRRR